MFRSTNNHPHDVDYIRDSDYHLPSLDRKIKPLKKIENDLRSIRERLLKEDRLNLLLS